MGAWRDKQFGSAHLVPLPNVRPQRHLCFNELTSVALTGTDNYLFDSLASDSHCLSIIKPFGGVDQPTSMSNISCLL